MTTEFLIERQIPEVSAIFANGGRLIKGAVLWTYVRDGRSSMAWEPEVAVIAAEGIGAGKVIWNSNMNSEVGE